MSLTQEQKQAAADLLVAELRAPVFFHKLANDYGIEPKTAEEAHEMLINGGKLRIIYEQKQQEKLASVGGSLLKRASAHIDQMFAEVVRQPHDSPAVESEIQKAATTVAARPELANAILTLQAA